MPTTLAVRDESTFGKTLNEFVVDLLTWNLNKTRNAQT
jgi:hypothetical protein